MKCCNCGDRKGTNEHYEYSGDLWCNVCYDYELLSRMENVIDDYRRFLINKKRSFDDFRFVMDYNLSNQPA